MKVIDKLKVLINKIFKKELPPEKATDPQLETEVRQIYVPKSQENDPEVFGICMSAVGIKFQPGDVLKDKKSDLICYIKEDSNIVYFDFWELHNRNEMPENEQGIFKLEKRITRDFVKIGKM